MMLSRLSLRSRLCRPAAARYLSSATSSSAVEESSGIPAASSPSQPQAPSSLMDKSDKNIFQRFFERHSIAKHTNRILVAESLLQAATSQASDLRWYGPGRIAKDFRSYQAILTMHIWMLHKRLISDEVDPHAAALIQEELFDIFWTDSSNRMRAFGVNEMLIAKNLKSVQQYTFMHCFHYDHCYTDLLDSPKERFEELKNLVQTHILLLNPEDHAARENSEDLAERIAWYIEAQYQNIVHDLPDDFYRKARIAWVDLPDFSELRDAAGKILEPNEIDPEDVLPLNWVRNVANDGSYYYWNTKTREAQWEKPH